MDPDVQLFEFYRLGRNEVEVLADDTALFVLALVHYIRPANVAELAGHVRLDLNELLLVCTKLRDAGMLHMRGPAGGTVAIELSHPGTQLLNALSASGDEAALKRAWSQYYRAKRLDVKDLTVGLACVIAIVAVLVVAYVYSGRIESLMMTYPAVAPVLLILLKMSAIIFPPLTGGIIGLSGISLFGWPRALLYDYIGTMCGAAVAFLLARRFRVAVVRRFWPLQTLNDWIEGRVPERRYFRPFLVIRLFTESMFDFLSYAAGLTQITFGSYFFATLLGCLPVKFLLFYFAGFGFNAGIALTLLLVGGFGLLAVYLKPAKYLRRLLRWGGRRRASTPTRG